MPGLPGPGICPTPRDEAPCVMAPPRVRPPRLSVEDKARAARRSRYRLRDRSRRLHPDQLHRVAACATKRIPGEAAKLVRTAGKGASWAGLEQCSSVWSCPCCSARIRQQRAVDLEAGVARWLEDGHAAVFLTLTVPHDYGDQLATVLDVVAGSFRKLLAGSSWQAEKLAYGIVGTVRAVEVTHGGNGWPPHFHVLVLLDRQLPAEQLELLRASWSRRWGRAVVAAGLRAPHPDHGVVAIGVGSSGVAGYLAKLQDGKGLGVEMTRADLKRGRRAGQVTPFELLAAAVDGEAAPFRLWQEYAIATQGRRFLTYSRGLKQLLALQLADVDDARVDDDVVEVV